MGKKEKKKKRARCQVVKDIDLCVGHIMLKTFNKRRQQK